MVAHAILFAGLSALGQWDVSVGADVTTRAGVTPLAAGVDPISQVRIEAEPNIGVLYRRDSDSFSLTYRPRIVQRFLPGSMAAVTGPLLMNQIDSAGRLQATRRLRIDGGVGVAVGTVAYNDALLIADPTNPGASTDSTVLNVLARGRVAYLTDADLDALRIGVSGTLSRVLDNQMMTVGVIDRTRIEANASYTFNPTRVDGVELAANAEVSLYPVGVGPTQTSAISLTVGWLREMSRRVTCAARGGAVALLGAGDPTILPSGGGDCTVETYRSAELQISGNFAAAIVGATSAVVATAEPRIQSSVDFRFFFPPDKGLRLIASFTGPIRVGGAVAPAPNVADASFLASLPFSWQLDPGLDIIIGAAAGVRGQLDGAFDQLDAQGFVSVSWSIDSAGSSRYERL